MRYTYLPFFPFSNYLTAMTSMTYHNRFTAHDLLEVNTIQVNIWIKYPI